MQQRRRLMAALVLAGGVVTAFFVTFNALFSDGPTRVLDPERLVTYGISLLAHGLFGAAGMQWGKGRWTLWTALAGGPSAAFALLYAVSEPGIAAWAILYSCIALGGAATGACLADRKPKAATPP